VKKTGLTALRSIGMGKMAVLLQPILEISSKGRRLHALECLIRGPVGTRLESPAALFEFVRSNETDYYFDRTCVKLALETAGALPGDPRVSLNVYGKTLIKDPDFATFVEGLSWGNAVAPGRVTMEIADYGKFAEDPALGAMVKSLKALGIQIALDDSGLGDPDFRLLLDLKPDYLKIDRFFVAGLATEATHKAILEGLMSLAGSLGFRIVAEGIETEEELKTVTDMGIELVQGYLFGEPKPADAYRTGMLVHGKGWDVPRSG